MYSNKEEAFPVADFFGNGRNQNNWSPHAVSQCRGSAVGHPSCALSPHLTPPPWGSLWCQSFSALSYLRILPHALLRATVLEPGDSAGPTKEMYTPHQLASPWGGVHKTLSPHPLQTGFFKGKCSQTLCYWRFIVSHARGVLPPQEVGGFFLKSEQEINRS